MKVQNLNYLQDWNIERKKPQPFSSKSTREIKILNKINQQPLSKKQ